MHDFVINCNLFFTAKDLVADSAWHTITWNYHCIFLEWGPFFECLQTKAAVKHAWGCEEYHWFVDFKHRLVELADVREVEHVLFYKCLLNFFICPVDE